MKRSSMMRRSASAEGQFLPNGLSLPNHYIPDSSAKRQQCQTLNHHPGQQQVVPSNVTLGGRRDPEVIAAEFRQRFPLAERPRNVMEISSQPPAHLYNNYPHIIIGGQPFYLIPSENSAHQYETDSYAYPQCVPIYEEIDPDVCSVASDQGEIGSVRQEPCSQSNSLSNRGGVPLPHQMQFRPVTSHSQTTNTSDGCSTNGFSPPSRPNAAGGRVMVNPLVRDVAFQDTSFSSDEGQKPFVPPSRPTAKLPHRSPATNSTSSSSIYYYSDTLKKTSPDAKLKVASIHSDELSSADSGFSSSNKPHKNAAGGEQYVSSSSCSSSSERAPVDTRIVLHEPVEGTKQSNTTQV